MTNMTSFHSLANSYFTKPPDYLLMVVFFNAILLGSVTGIDKLIYRSDGGGGGGNGSISSTSASATTTNFCFIESIRNV